MITAPPAPHTTDSAQVHAAAVRKLAGRPTPRETEKAEQDEQAERDARSGEDAGQPAPTMATGGRPATRKSGTKRAPSGRKAQKPS